MVGILGSLRCFERARRLAPQTCCAAYRMVGSRMGVKSHCPCATECGTWVRTPARSPTGRPTRRRRPQLWARIMQSQTKRASVALVLAPQNVLNRAVMSPRSSGEASWPPTKVSGLNHSSVSHQWSFLPPSLPRGASATRDAGGGRRGVSSVTVDIRWRGKW